MKKAEQSHSGEAGKFTTGSTMSHVVVMTATGSIGLVAIFIVDALNLLYISMLGQQELAAAVGFAGTIMFFTLSVSIGLTIATAALVARALGARDRERAGMLAGASLIIMTLTTAIITAVVFIYLRELLVVIGARDETLEIANGFLRIVMPSAPVVALGMCLAAILRALGDARRAMFVTLSGGVAAAVFDPLFIFGFDMGVNGAAISTVISRLFLVAFGYYGAVSIHRLPKMPDIRQVFAVLKPFFAIGAPAMLTQLATPFGNAVVTAQIAQFGDGPVAGWAIVGRIIPVFFGAIFALSGAVGPILSQNLGAGLTGRLFTTMRDSLTFITLYVIAVWMVMALSAGGIASIFNASGEARDLIIFFCQIVTFSFLFNGALFVANAAFNNLGFALYSTMFNWGRSTLGTIPLVLLGAKLAGAEGVLAGWGLGTVIFGIGAVIVCFRVIRYIDTNHPKMAGHLPPPPAASQSAFSTGKASTADWDL
jgi:putative MATE family efflux protein